MKITLVGHTIPGSGVNGVSIGINKYIYNLGLELHKMGHDVELFIRNDFKPKESWIKTIYSPKFTWFIYPYFLGKKIKKIKSDVYHSDYVTTGVPLIKKNKKPVIVTLHGAEPFEYNKTNMKRMDKIRLKWYMKSFEKIKKADVFIVMSNFAKKKFLKYTDLPEEKIFVTYNGINFNKYFPIKREENNEIKIGYLGGLDGRKNVILLVEAFKKLIKERNNIELHVAGTGKNLEIFKNMKIPNAYFYGFLHDKKINNFLNSLDIFVYPTLNEGFGLPPLEAMSAGVPVIAANTCSMPEVIGDAGILFEPNINDLYEKLNKLIDNKNLRNKLSKRGLERAKKFTWERCAKNTLKIYRKL